MYLEAALLCRILDEQIIQCENSFPPLEHFLEACV